VHPKVLSRRRASTLLRTAVAGELGMAVETL
ncbi:MAG: TetR family transcriptional regulator, partial [Nonomuraea sp.]|nr:TetR family transcriptional regulator [Nonomuraea sp.]